MQLDPNRNDYPLIVQRRKTGTRYGTGLRVWALDAAIADADHVAENFVDDEVVVVDRRNGKVCYSTETGHSTYIPKE